MHIIVDSAVTILCLKITKVIGSSPIKSPLAEVYNILLLMERRDRFTYVQCMENVSGGEPSGCTYEGSNPSLSTDRNGRDIARAQARSASDI